MSKTIAVGARFANNHDDGLEKERLLPSNSSLSLTGIIYSGAIHTPKKLDQMCVVLCYR